MKKRRVSKRKFTHVFQGMWVKDFQAERGQPTYAFESPRGYLFIYS